ncbi:MAG: hotdog fold thioesterase [Deltaproteobacteria bacterium]|nr:hotdog fold thioesterase [Deltaproteobacteria bacterium]
MDELRAKIENDPWAVFLGIKLETLERSHARCSVVVKAEMLNFLGAVHGALVFSLADFAFSAASNSDYSPSLALDISGSFLKGAAVGDTLSAEARLLHTTKRTGLYRMDVFRNQELIATFNGTVFRKV